MRLGRIDLVRLVEEAQDLAEFEESLAEAVRALPADAAALIEFLEAPTADAFNVPPQQAIDYFKAKGLQPTFSYADMMESAHDSAFTVAKMMDVDMLGQVRASLDLAMANGKPFKEWADEITPILQSGGWWGRKAVKDPLTGKEVVAQLGSPWRLETIFRTNMQTAYAAGAWQEIKANAATAPYLMYDAVDDDRTRPLHASWDQTVLPVTDDWWGTHFPPNGYNCRCGVIQLSGDEVASLGLQVSIDPPQNGSFDWTNPRNGEVLVIPKGIDAGFAHNAGQSWAWKQKQLLKEKVDALPPDMKAAAKAAAQQAQKLSQDAIEAATQAQADAASAQAKAALARAQAKAAEKAKQWAAKEQIDLIAKGDKGALGTGAQFKVKALAEAKKIAAWPEMMPVEQLDKVNEIAAMLKAKQVQSQGLSLYKKAILDGKNPPPAAVKAFLSLPEGEADAWLTKLEAEKAALAAEKAKEAAEAAKKAAGADPSASAKAPEPVPPNPSSMVVIGRKPGGSVPGAMYQDTETGQKWLVKFPPSEDAVLNEVLAGRLYKLAGVEAPELHAITIDGKSAIASRIIDGITEVDAKTLAATPSVIDGFAVDAWLANWDAVGQTFDNTVLVGGRGVRIDVGGALRYRAQGGLKGQAFGRTVNEIDSLRDGTNSQARAVFGAMTPDEIERSVERVLSVREADIRAIVSKFGPRDDSERSALADLLIARQRDLAKRYPAAAERVRLRAGGQAATESAGRVTDQEQRWVEESRVNGYGFATDSDQIEDNMVLVHTFKRADDTDATRGYFKLLPGASRELAQRIAASGGAGNAVALGDARDAILSAVKSINFRADKGQPLDATVAAKVKTAVDKIGSAIEALRVASGKAKDPRPLALKSQALLEWMRDLAEAGKGAADGAKAVKLPRVFDTKAFPDEITFDLLAETIEAAGLKLQRKTGTYKFKAAEFRRSFAKESAGEGELYGANVRFEATMPDGSLVTYFPHDSGVAFAVQGVVKIDVPGRGVEATGGVFRALDAMGIKSTRATDTDRKHLYLNSFARIRLLSNDNATRALKGNAAQLRAEFEAVTDRGDAGLKAKLDILKRATGVDIEASDGWRNVGGVRQAFGHGRAYQLRPDISAADAEKLGKTHILYHNPKGFGTDAGSGVFDRLKTVIEGGGMFASLTDRMRRGVKLAGSSVMDDLGTGGGDYLFTRIRSRSVAKGTGVYWRTNALRRMDAITYDSDQFGNTNPAHVDQNRLGQSIDDFKRAATSGSNETIFKGGLSIFDDVEKVVLQDAAEVRAAIAWMRQQGYNTWPDGRTLDEVIVVKGGI